MDESQLTSLLDSGLPGFSFTARDTNSLDPATGLQSSTLLSSPIDPDEVVTRSTLNVEAETGIPLPSPILSSAEDITPATDLSSSSATQDDLIGTSTQGLIVGNSEVEALAADAPIQAANILLLPDLVGQFGTITLPQSLTPGGQGQVQVRLTNQGIVPAIGSPAIDLYFSSNTTLDSSDISLGRINTNSLLLLVGQTQTYSTAVTVPTTLPSGSYYLLANIDASSVLLELNETNNLAISSNTFTLAPPVTVTANLANDTAANGTTNTDRITADATITGSATNANRLATLTAGFDTAPISSYVNITTDIAGNGSFTLSRTRLEQIYGGVLTEGSHTLHLRAQDTLGNLSTVDLNFTLDTTAPTPLTLTLDPAFDTAPVGDGRTLAETVTLTGQTEAGAIATLQTIGNSATANASGQFQFSNIALDLGTNTFIVQSTDVAGNVSGAVTTQIIRSSPGDVVTQWNNILLNAIQTDKTAPPLAARNMAIVQAAVFDAVNSIDQSYTPYYISAIAPAGASVEAAAVAAAYYTLVSLYPAQQATFDAALAQSLTAIPDGQAKTDGVLLGQRVAGAILAWRQSDGSDRPTPYTPGTEPGDWQPTPPAYQAALASHWGSVTPFALDSGDQFRPDGPPALDSADYAVDFNQVKELGRNDSTTRTADQTQIAQFWADGAGTYTPAGHWNQIAQEVSLRQGNSLIENARLLALLDVGLADAGVAAWDAKYTYNFWRPVTAIQQADTDGNPLTEADPTWTSLLTTPPFPDYVSGHSTYSGTADAILTDLLGDDLSFTNGSVGLTGVSRTFTNFTAAADEAGISRIYGGIHFNSANQDGLALGRSIGSYVVDQVIEAVPVLVQAQLANDTAPQGTTNVDTLTSDPTIAVRVLDRSRLTTLKVGLDQMETTAFADVTAEVGANGDLTLSQARLEQILGTPLVDGQHTVYLQATDTQGNLLQVQVSFTLDTAAPTVDVEVPIADGDHSTTARLIGTVTDTGSGAAPIGSVVLDGQPATNLTVDGEGEFDQALSSTPLTAGTHQVSLTAFDQAGNAVQTAVNFAVTPDEFVIGPTPSIGWGAIGADPIILGEQNSFLVQTAIDGVELGQVAGSRKLRFDVEANFDISDTTQAIEDQLLVYLVDANGQTLLDQGESGTPVFSLAGTKAEFTPGLVRFDGTTVEIDLTSLADQSSGRLVFQFVNLDGDTGSRIKLHNFTNEVDPTGVESPVFSRSVNRVTAGGAIDTATLNASPDLQLQWSKVHLDAATGLYVADISVRNLGEPTGRQVAIVFADLPDGVQLLNASGVDGSGNPYINLQSAITAGGLDKGASSDVVQIVLSNPNLLQFDLQPMVLVGADNQAPVFNAVGALTVLPGDTLEVPLVAIDPDGDRVTFSIRSDNPLPIGTLRADNTLVFNPNPEEIGNYSFTLIATDGALTTEQQVTLTVAADPVTTTRISGVIQNTDQQPLSGVLIDLGGTQVETAADGSFTLEFSGALPSDTLKVHGESISGNYPFIAEKLPLLLGHEVYDNVNNIVVRPIYLPPIDVATAVPIDPDEDILVTTTTIPGASVFVEAGSLLNQEGDYYTGQLSITEVPTDFTPAALPANLKPDLVVTIQPGEMVFTQPARLALPNRAGYAPGKLMDLWSINPQTGDFDKVGVGRVSADGSVVETIEGGIRNSSWHFFTPPGLFNSPDGNPRNPDLGCPECQASAELTSSVELHSGAVIESHSLAPYQSLGMNRGLMLTYDSLRADPRPILHFGYSNIQPNNNKLVGMLSVTHDGFNYQVPGFAGGQYGLEGGEHVWSIESSEADAAIQADLSFLSSGRYQYTLRSGLYQQFDEQFAGSLNSSFGEFIHVNSINSAFGSGWGLAGLQELVENDDGSILLIDGDGSELLFRRGANGSYISPPGDFSTLVRSSDGTFRRTLKDQTVYQFNTQNQLTLVRDRNSNEMRYVYDGTGKLTTIIDPVGLETTFSYTGDRISAITDPTNRTTQLEYDAAGNLTRIIDPDETSRSWEYDSRHHMTAETDQRGYREETVYDFAGRAIQGVRKDGSVIQIAPVQTEGLLRADATSDPLLAPATPVLNSEATTSYSDANGNVTMTQLDRAGQAVEQSDGSGQLPTTQRNGRNLVSSSIDARGNSTIYSYDYRGNVTTVQEDLTQTSLDTGISFLPGSSFAIDYESEVTVGNLNGDAFPDLVTRDLSSEQLLVSLGDGNGSFTASGIINVPYPTTWTLADLNKDGLLDLVTGTYEYVDDVTSGVISVSMGNGNGTFALNTNFNVTYEPTTLKVADLNNDGFLDIVSANSSYNGSVSVLLGDGATFAPRVDSSLGIYFERIELGDFDGDGDLDVVAIDEDQLSIRLGNGDGSFAADPVFEEDFNRDTNGLPVIALADFDGDENLDVLIGLGYDTEGCSIYLGNGDGTLEEEILVPVSGGAATVVVSDVNQDGYLDLAVSSGSGSYESSGTRILLGDDTGAFVTSVPVSDQSLDQLLLEDLDQDGDLDVILADSDSVSSSLQLSLSPSLQTSRVQVTQQFEYDATFSQVTRETDELGRITLYDIDPLTGNRRSMTEVVEAIGGTDDIITYYTYTTQGQLDTETDPLGRIADYDYDPFGRLVKITFAKGTVDEAVQQFEYDAAGNQTAMIDENGNRTEYGYDEMNRLVTVIEADPDGAGSLESPETSFTYDEVGNQVTMTDANSNVTRQEYDAIGRLVKVIEADPDGTGALTSPVTTYIYDQSDNQVGMIDPLGRETQNVYDSRNRLVQIVRPDGSTNAYQYDADNNRVGYIDANGNQTRFVYDERDRLIRLIDADNQSTTLTYDAADQLIAEVDANNHQTQYRYDDLGRQTAVIDPRGKATTMVYDAVGNMTAVTDRLNHTTQYGYNNRNWQTQVIDSLNHTTTTAYDDVGNIVSVTDALDHTTSYGYDALNRQISITDALNHASTMAYDAIGNRIAMTDALNRTTRYRYDGLHRLIAVTDPLEHTTTQAYDSVDNLIAVTDPLGHTTRYGYDLLDRRTTVTDALGEITTTAYDFNGNVAAITDPANNTTTYEYDSLNRLETETNVLGKTRSYDYDAVGNLIETIDRNGRKRTFTYNENDWQTDEQWWDANDSVIRTIASTYDDEGRLTSASDPDSTYSYTYDAADRLTSVDNQGTPGIPQVVFDYSYDNADRLTTVTDTIAGTQSGTNGYSYDNADRLVQITQSGNGVTDKRVNISYDAANQMEQLWRYGDLTGTQLVTESDYSFDDAGRLVQLVHQQGTITIANYEFEYDESDRLTEFTSSDGMSVYDYDDRNQLTESDHSYQSDEDYTYDANGNRINTGYQIGTNNQLLSDGIYNYEYDDEGNRTKRTEIATGKVTEYTWDHRNRLTQVVEKDAGGVTTKQVQYSYDVFDRRIAKEVDPDGAGSSPVEVERLVYDGDNIALTFNATGSLTHRYLYGSGVDQILADENAQGQVNWALTDHQGTVRDVVDSSGAVQNHLSYDSFGQITSETSPTVDFRFSYTGRELDEETGQYYHRARYYDATNGRFLSEDPIGFEAGDANLYRYVSNSPTNWTDPFGEDLYDALDTADEFFAGFADTVTFGTSTQLREYIYGDIATQNHQGGVFTGGQVAGAVATTALGFAAPTRLVGSVSWAQRFAQGYTVASTGIGAYRSTRNILAGCGTWTDYLAYAPLAGYAGARGTRYLRGLGGIDDFAARLGRRQPISLDLFGGRNSQVPGAINVDLLAERGSRIRSSISDLNRLLPSGHVDEIIASGPQAEFLEEASKLLKPGGRIFINATRRNRYGKLPSDDTLSNLGLRVVQRNGDLNSRFANQEFRFTDGRPMPTSSVRTTILERIP